MANPIVGEIKREARRRHAPFKQLKAAIETGIVESGLRNLPGGTGDSAGWRQERRSLYPDPTNVRASVRRFFDEAAAKDRPGVSSGELAAEVQRPAAQYRGRYGQEAAKAQSILEGLSGVPYNDQVASTGIRAVNTLQTSSALDSGAYESAKRLSIVGQMLASRRGTDSPLFRSGVLSTQPPNRADYMRSTLTGSVRSTGGGSGASAPSGKGDVTNFDGKPVASWIVPLLRQARQQGWKGTVTSGYRSDAAQTAIYKSGVRPAAVPRSMGGAGSNHERTGFLQGAVDVTDAPTLSRILQRKGSRLKWAGAKDPVHFSVPRGGSY